MFALKRSSKPGTGSTLLTGGCCQPAAATVAPDQSSMRRCRRLPCSAVNRLSPQALLVTPPSPYRRRWPWHSPCHARSSAGRLRAPRPARRTSTTRSAACGPGPPPPPCGQACRGRRNVAHTSDSVRCRCQRSQPQASSTIIRRSTLLPALLIPCSRLSGPDWYGVGVRPTIAPTCRRLLNFRQPNSSNTKSHEPDNPIPARSRRRRTRTTCGVSSRRIRALRSFSSSLTC